MKLRILTFWPLAVIPCVAWWSFGNHHLVSPAHDLCATEAPKIMHEVPETQFGEVSQQEIRDSISANSKPAVLASVGENASVRNQLESEIAFAINTKLFGKYHPFEIGDLPDGNLKSQLGKISPEARQKAMDKLHSITFGVHDAANCLRVDQGGGIYFACNELDEHHSESVPVSETTSKNETVPGTFNAPIPFSSPPTTTSGGRSQRNHGFAVMKNQELRADSTSDSSRNPSKSLSF